MTQHPVSYVHSSGRHMSAAVLPYRNHLATSISTMRTLTRRLWLQTAGQDMAEFALLAGFIAVAGTAALPTASLRVERIYRRVRRRLRRAAGLDPLPTDNQIPP